MMLGTYLHCLISRYLRIDWATTPNPLATKLGMERREGAVFFYGFGQELIVEKLTAKEASRFVLTLP